MSIRVRSRRGGRLLLLPISLALVISPSPTQAENLWEHYSRVELSGNARSQPESLIRFDLDVAGDSRPEIFLTDNAAMERGIYGNWFVYSHHREEPCLLAVLVLNAKFSSYDRAARTLTTPFGGGPGGYAVRTYRLAPDGVESEEIRRVDGEMMDRSRDLDWIENKEIATRYARVDEFYEGPKDEESLWRSSKNGGLAAPSSLLTGLSSQNDSGQILPCRLLSQLESRDESILDHYYRENGLGVHSQRPEEFFRLDLDLDQDGTPETLISHAPRSRAGPIWSWFVYSTAGERSCFAGQVHLDLESYVFDAYSRSLRSFNRNKDRSAESEFRLEGGSIVWTRRSWDREAAGEAEARFLEEKAGFLASLETPAVLHASALALELSGLLDLEPWGGAFVPQGSSFRRVSATGRVAPNGLYWPIGHCGDSLARSRSAPLNLVPAQVGAKPINWNFQLDVDPPTIGIGVSSSFDVQSSILVAYGDAKSGVAPESLVLSLDGLRISERCEPETGYSVCTPPLAMGLGTHVAVASILDKEGNSREVEYEFSIQQDQTPPEVRVNRFADSTLVNQAEVAIEIDLWDRDSGIDTKSFRLTMDGAPVEGCEVDVGGASCPPRHLMEGVRQFSATVADRSGNSATKAFKMTVSEDFAGPNIDQLSPEDGGVLANPESVRLTARLWDSDHSVDSDSLEVSLDGTSISGSCRVDLGELSCVLPELSIGSHTWFVRVNDWAGNPGSATATFRAVLDHDPPEISVLGPAGATLYNRFEIEPSFAMIDAGVGLDLQRLRVLVDERPIEGCFLEGGMTRCPIQKLSAGQHSFRAQVADLAHNVAEASYLLNLETDDQGPEIVLVKPSDGPLLPVGAKVLDFTVSDAKSGVVPSSFRAKLDGQSLRCEPRESTVRCAVGPLLPGLHRLEAEAIDRVGISGRFSRTVRSGL